MVKRRDTTLLYLALKLLHEARGGAATFTSTLEI